MQPILYSRRFATGNRDIDAQHRALFSVANQLMFAADVRADADLFLRGLDFLVRYCSWHFSAEERAMDQAGYPGLDRHRQHHRALAERVARMQQNTQAVGPSEEMRQELHRIISDWFAFHIRILDQDFVQFLRLRDPDGVAQGAVPPPTGPAGRDSGDLSSVTGDVVEDDPDAVFDKKVRRFW